MDAVDKLDFVPVGAEITVEYDEGTTAAIDMHDGSKVLLTKLSGDWNPFNRESAFAKINESRSQGQLLTGLIYIDESSRDIHDILKTTHVPLNQLGEKDLCPGNATLQEINAGFR